MSHFTSKFCTFCYKSNGLTSQSVHSLSTIALFYKLLERFSGDSGSNKLVASVKKLFGSSLQCCISCQETLDQFCETYHKFKCLELELDRTLDKLGSKIQLTNRIPTRWASLNKMLDEAFKNDRVKKEMSQEALRKLRQSVVKAGHLRSKKSQPRVKIYSRKVTSSYHSRSRSNSETASNDEKAETNLHTEESIATTIDSSNKPCIITEMEPMKTDPEHTFETGWPVDEQAIQEPSSSLIIGEVFTQCLVKTENDSSPQQDSDDFILTSSALNEQKQSYSFRQNRVSRFSTENDSESNRDQISDYEDFLLNNDAKSDTRSKPIKQIKTNEYNVIHTGNLENGNGTSNFYSDGVPQGFLVSSSGSRKARQCDVCNIWLKSSGALYRHKVKFHRDPIKCPICNKVLSRIDNMKRHVRDQH